MSLNKQDNNPTCYEIVPTQKHDSLKGQSGTEYLTNVPCNAPYIVHLDQTCYVNLSPFILIDFS